MPDYLPAGLSMNALRGLWLIANGVDPAQVHGRSLASLRRFHLLGWRCTLTWTGYKCLIGAINRGWNPRRNIKVKRKR